MHRFARTFFPCSVPFLSVFTTMIKTLIVSRMAFAYHVMQHGCVYLVSWYSTTLFFVNNVYYTFKLQSRSLLVNILQLILNVRQLWRHFRRIL